MSLEDLLNVEIDSVLGASGYQQKVTVAPAAITIITADEIRRYGYRTLADALRSVPGFYVTSDRNYSYLGIRGFGRPGDYNSRILLLVNGHRTNDNIYGQALIGTEFPIDIDLIERIEVIRGPNTSLYVADAILGVINVIIKPARKQKNLTASGEAASFAAYKTRLTYGRQFSDGVELLLSGSYYNNPGPARIYFPEFDSPATNNGIAQSVDSDESEQLLANLTYRGFRLDAAYGSREKHIPTGSFGTAFNDPNTRTLDARGYVDLAYDHKFGEDWGVTGHLYYDDYRYNGVYVYASQSPGLPVVNEDPAKGQWWGAQFALSKRLGDSQTLIAGGEYQDNFEQYQANYDNQPFFSYFSGAPKSSFFAAYVQDEIRLRSNLTLDVGLRHDQYSTFGGTTNPRAALIYQPFEKTTVKFLYGESFRPPTAYELNYAGPGQEGNSHLRPETARTSEIVVEQYIQGGLRVLVSGYYYPIRGQISQEIDPANGNIVYQNSDQSDLRGIEISLKKETRHGLEVAGGLSLQKADHGTSDVSLTNSPHVLGQARLSLPFFQKKILASLDATYLSRRFTTAGYSVASYILPDLTLVSHSFMRMEISASVYNFLNHRYGDPGSTGDTEDVIVQNGRTFRLKLTYHF